MPEVILTEYGLLVAKWQNRKGFSPQNIVALRYVMVLSSFDSARAWGQRH